MASFKIAITNCLDFTDYTPVALPQYRSKHIYDWPQPQTIRLWEQYVVWAQPWQLSDVIKLQILSEIGPIHASLIDSYTGQVIDKVQFTQKQQNLLQPTFYIYELSLALDSYPQGWYYIVLEFGDPVVYRVISNLLDFKEVHEDSILIAYKHFKYRGSMYFENGFAPTIRLNGTMKYLKPGVSRTVYENQDADMTLLDSKPHPIWKFYFGGPEGVPDFFINKMNEIVNLSDVQYDGRYYTPSTEGAQFDESAIDGYPLRGWSIELREKYQRDGKVYTADQGLIQGGLTVVVNVDKKAFVEENPDGFFDVINIE